MLSSRGKEIHELGIQDLSRNAIPRREPRQRQLKRIRQQLRPRITLLPCRHGRDTNLEFPLHASPSRGNDHAQCEMRMQVRAGDPHLESCGAGLADGWGDQSDGRDAVFQPPAYVDWCPVVLDEPFVRVDVWGEEGHDIGEGFEETGEEVSPHVREVFGVGPLRVGVG